MEYFAEYGLFLAKAVTWVVAILVVVLGIVALSSRNKGESKAHIEIKKLNEKFDETSLAIKEVMLGKEGRKQLEKEFKAKRKADEKKPDESKPRVFVLNFDGDIKASAVAHLREEITAVLMVARAQDEVFVKLESAGGMVHAYGLAASQLVRIKNKKIPLTVAVDKVAASGGYMMACVADKILCAPFAVVGSIGVVAQLPNFNRLLKKHDIDFEMITAGEYKRTLTVFGENTDKAREKFKEDIEDTHELFKSFIMQNRNSLDIEKVATGEHWFGTRAKELTLVDEISTSDDYLLEKSEHADLYQITYTSKKNLSEKFAGFLSQVADRVQLNFWNRSREQQLP